MGGPGGAALIRNEQFLAWRGAVHFTAGQQTVQTSRPQSVSAGKKGEEEQAPGQTGTVVPAGG